MICSVFIWCSSLENQLVCCLIRSWIIFDKILFKLDIFFYYKDVKSYWTTARSHLRFQATLHGTPLLQCTQITNGNPNTHIQRCNRINETMSFQPKSFTVPNEVVHSLIINYTHTHTHTHIRSSTIRNLPRCDRTKQSPDKTLDTVHTSLLSSFWHIWKNRMGEPTSIRRVLLCLPCSLLSTDPNGAVVMTTDC
jgi:hypothetical protein